MRVFANVDAVGTNVCECRRKRLIWVRFPYALPNVKAFSKIACIFRTIPHNREMSLPKDWPYQVKSGNAVIPIYHSKTSRGYDEFKVVWYDANRKRRFKTFADFEEAKKHAANINAAIGNGEISAITLSNDDRLIYLRAKDALHGSGTSLDVAAAEFAYAVKRIGAARVREAVDYFARIHTGVNSRPVKEVVDQFLAEKEKPSQPNIRPASDRYLADITFRLNRFANAFQCDLNTVRPEQVKEFLTSLKVGGRSYVNYARAIATLVNFAKARKWFPKDADLLDGIDTDFDDEGAIEIFTSKELSKLLAHAEAELVAFLAIGAFAGLRHAELLRLDWSEVRPKFIEVTKGKAKTRSRRLVPIQPNLSRWLTPYRKDSGSVVPFKAMFRPIQKLVTDSGVKWKQNGLRHSFCSYRFALCKNENEVAMEAGNSPEKLYRHYRELVTEADAKAWFSIKPGKIEKIVPMPKAG